MRRILIEVFVIAMTAFAGLCGCSESWKPNQEQNKQKAAKMYEHQQLRKSEKGDPKVDPPEEKK